MKTISKYTLVLIATMLLSTWIFAQKEKEIRIKILKKENGKTELIDTIIQMPGDSIMAFWASPDFEHMQRKTDSLMEIFHQRMEHFSLDNESIMRDVESKMKDVEIHMKKLNDSILKHKIEISIPKLPELDSAHMKELEEKLKKIDSTHKRIWVMKPGDVEEIKIHMDLNLDSIIRESTKSIHLLDSMEFDIHLPDMEQLDESIREGMKEARFFLLDDDFEWQENDKEDIRYIDGKIIKIKKDRNGKITKAIIMSPDGENIEVKEGMEAYRFVTEEGEEIIIEDHPE